MNFILLSLLLLIQGIPFQQGGTVTGVLRDSEGKPLPGVRMAAIAHASSIEETITAAAMAGLAETDEQGRFTLENIPPGRYSIAAGRLDLQTLLSGHSEPGCCGSPDDCGGNDHVRHQLRPQRLQFGQGPRGSPRRRPSTR